MKRILVIDDDDQFRNMMLHTLKRAGYEIEVAYDGEDGMRKQQDQPFDLIITDIIMPNKEGIGLILDLKNDYPDLKIIAVSGGGSVLPNDYLEIAEKLGAHRTLSKPFERKELLNMIDELLK